MVDLIEGGTNVGGTYVGGTYIGGTYVGGRKVTASLISVSWPLSTKFEIANKSLTFCIVLLEMKKKCNNNIIMSFCDTNKNYLM